MVNTREIDYDGMEEITIIIFELEHRQQAEKGDLKKKAEKNADKSIKRK